jgi:hypothetical protein
MAKQQKGDTHVYVHASMVQSILLILYSADGVSCLQDPPRRRRPPKKPAALAAEAPLTSGARPSIFSRPRAPPKIRPPVPLTEKEKFDRLQGRKDQQQQQRPFANEETAPAAGDYVDEELPAEQPVEEPVRPVQGRRGGGGWRAREPQVPTTTTTTTTTTTAPPKQPAAAQEYDYYYYDEELPAQEGSQGQGQQGQQQPQRQPAAESLPTTGSRFGATGKGSVTFSH